MQRDPRALLWDICVAGDDIVAFVDGKNIEEYRVNGMVHSAVERKFEIIGEALSHLRKIDPATANMIPEIERIIAFRNLLIHGYANIDHARVWRIARDSLPGMRRAAEELLRKLDRR